VEEELQNNHKKHIMIAIAVVAIVAVIGIVTLKNGPTTGDTDLVVDLGAFPNGDTFVRSNDTNPVVTLKTTEGDISLELYMDKTPITAGNFLELAQSGFYTGTLFHRVIDNFMIQGGDPNSKRGDVELYGRGGPGYTIEDEFVLGLSNLRGTIAMANIGQPNTGGSQFFINFTNNIGLDHDKQPLTSKHPVFGQVVDGQGVVDAIIRVETDSRDLPLKPIVIEEVVIFPGKSAEEVVEENKTEEVMEEANEEVSSGEDSIEELEVSYLPIQFSIPTFFSL
jgi:peptidylprolyl isomerase